MDYCAIGQRIRKIRKAHGLSQEELAEKVGISTTHMSHIETGNTKLSLPVFVELAKILLPPQYPTPPGQAPVYTSVLTGEKIHFLSAKIDLFRLALTPYSQKPRKRLEDKRLRGFNCVSISVRREITIPVRCIRSRNRKSDAPALLPIEI